MATATGRRSPACLDRITFRTSREMEFFSERELTAQTGHAREEWPAMIVKELVDNALDACEEHGVAPEITVLVDESGITVADNGPGIPTRTIEAVVDFTVRVSSREAYVSPTRGAQGNALKTLVGIPYVLDPENGRLVITSGGTAYSIQCGLDAISQRPTFDREETMVSENGEGSNFYKSCVQLRWKSGQPVNPAQITALCRGFVLFNPHLSLTLDLFGTETSWEATDSAWIKWKPNQPTSPHWYDLPRFKRLVGAYIAHDRENDIRRTVGSFLAEFDGLTGSRKRKAAIDDAGMLRVQLSELAGERELRDDLIERLLAAMKKHTRPVTPYRLGQIGEKHFSDRQRSNTSN
jgi:DNA topoisomerase VI subunit B